MSYHFIMEKRGEILIDENIKIKYENRVSKGNQLFLVHTQNIE